MHNMICNDVLNILGMSDMNGKIFDVDMGSYLIFNGSYIVTPNAVIRHKHDTVFDIFTNVKLAEYLLNVLIKKEEIENGLYVKMITIDEVMNQALSFLQRGVVVHSSVGEFRSGIYFNYCLACIEMMFLLSGTPLSYDLHSIDFTKEYIEATYNSSKGR